MNLAVTSNDPDFCIGTDSGRILRTRDGGLNWEGVCSKRLEDGSYTSTRFDVTTNYGVHFDPFDPKRMFISYTDIGLFRSENGGAGGSALRQRCSSTTGSIRHIGWRSIPRSDVGCDELHSRLAAPQDVARPGARSLCRRRRDE
jgi:hypothetical protein